MFMKKTIQDIALQWFAIYICGLAAIICLLPFWLIIAASLTSEIEIIKNGYSLIPSVFSMEAYRIIFSNPARIFRSYMITGFVTICGGLGGLFLTTMTAYTLMRKNFKIRNHLAFFFYFTTLFSGGLIPSYILISQYLNMKDTIAVLIIPSLMGAWNIFLMRNFMNEIPHEIAESAQIDGANEFIIFIKLYLPLSTAGLATIGLFICLGYWNSWMPTMLYINKPEMYTLQYLLMDMLASIRALREMSFIANIPIQDMPSESFKMAMAVIVTGPIILVYPFVQKYFVKGLTVGAVKG